MLILLCMVLKAPAQEIQPETRYEWLLVRLELSTPEDSLSEYAGQLLRQAKQLAGEQEFDLANLYLEELLSTLEAEDADTGIINTGLSEGELINQFSFSIIGGLDFNYQEFETGYFQDDSTILEEIKNPYTGFTINYRNESHFSIQNALRFDHQNYRNDLNLQWQPAVWLDIRYTNYWNHAREYAYNSFVENGLLLKSSSSLTPGIRWLIENEFRYKNFTGSDPLYLDYYRNRAQLGISGMGWNTSYLFERFENLGGEETDYRQHLIRANFQGNIPPVFALPLSIEAACRDYVLRLGDSLAVNRFNQIALYLTVDISLTEVLRLVIEENYLFKSYREKSAFEPDYHLNFLRPGIGIRLNRYLEGSLGLEWELKKHLTAGNDPYDVTEQDYNASGFFAGITYLSSGGAYLMVNAGYQWRRYQNSVSGEIISLYTDRNILSVMIMGYFPVTENIQMNLFAIYDDDQDVDYDQQNTQSTIFTLELEYHL